MFVALARAAGIPAREIDGFANTKNTKERPLSLVKDVLHAWPEYWDKDSESWIMVDPTWGNTTNGIDYFNTLDFDHFAFVVKGKDSSYPVPAGGYKRPQDISAKDVNVEISSNFSGRPDLQMSVILPKESPSWSDLSGVVRVRNLGDAISDSDNLKVSADFLLPSRKNTTINKIPPFGYQDVPINFKNSSFLTTKTDLITIQFGKNIYQKKVLISPFVSGNLFIGGGIFVALCILSIVAFKSRRISIPR